MRTSLLKRTAALVACSLALAGASAALAQGPAKPVAVVAFSGYDELMKDIDFLGGLAQQPGASQAIQGVVMGMTGGKGLVGLDQTQPIGVVVQHDGVSPSGAICLPVTDLNQLLEIFKNFGVTSEPGDGGLTVIKAQGQSIYAKTSGKWALLSMAPQMLEASPEDPGSVFAPLVKDYDLAVSLDVQNVPPELRQTGVEMMSQSARAGLSKMDGESDEAYAERQKQVEAQLGEIKRFVDELATFTIGLAIDGQGQKAYMDFAYTAVPGTKLAEDLAAGASATTNFAGFFQPEAAMTLSFASKVTGADAAQLDQMVSTLRTKAAEAIDGEDKIKSAEAKTVAKEGVNDFIDALKATIEGGVMDGGAVLNMAPDALTFVAGGRIGDPAKVESGLKKIAEAAAKEHPEAPKVSWASSKHGDVTFHTFSQPVPPESKEMRQMVGDNVDMAVGIGKESVFFALGRNCVAEVAKIIDASAKTPAKPVAPVEMTVALSQIVNVAKEFAPPEKKAQVQMIADMLANETNGRDHFRIVTMPIDNGLRTRIEAEEGVLRAVAMGAMAAQMEGAGAPPPAAVPAGVPAGVQ